MLKAVSIAALMVLLAVPQLLHAQANSLFVEDLTWEEVAAALKAVIKPVDSTLRFEEVR